MKIKRIRKSRRGKIEIIPMIDIMFFLLATFMLTTLATQHYDALPVNLTKGEAAQIDNRDKITIAIDEKNQVFLNEKLIAIDHIENALIPLLKEKNKTVIIASDKNSLQGTTTQAMIAARRAGAEKFSIMVKN